MRLKVLIVDSELQEKRAMVNVIAIDDGYLQLQVFAAAEGPSSVYSQLEVAIMLCEAEGGCVGVVIGPLTCVGLVGLQQLVEVSGFEGRGEFADFLCDDC